MSTVEVRDLVSFLGILGVPSIFSMTIWCVRTCKSFMKQLKILEEAQKAQMRSQLIKDYHFYEERGWISDVELSEWQNQYNAYHVLKGPNGVLEHRFNILKSLPNKEV